jgi:hypothetical protein
VTRPTKAQREAWTPLGIGWWDWAPLAQASPCARLLWLALYSSAPARRCPPGLWAGGPAVMAEASRLQLDQVAEALAELRELRLVEYDDGARVGRLLVLPDRLDRPANGNGIKAWWRMFRGVPACTVRDSHAETLRELVGHFTPNHQKVWDETFGTLPTPLRVPARLPSSNGSPNGSGNRSGNGSDRCDIAENRNGSDNGSRNRQGEGEGSSSIPDPGSRSRSSREITTSDPLVAAGWEAFERRRGAAAVDLVDEGLRRFGPRSSAPEYPTASSERFK